MYRNDEFNHITKYAENQSFCFQPSTLFPCVPLQRSIDHEKHNKLIRLIYLELHFHI